MNVLFAGGLECWRQRSLRYAQDYKRNYFNDLIELHDSLGLSVRLGGAVAMASLVGCNSVTSFLFSLLFGRPFVKRFALCYRTVVCPVL